MEQPTMIVITGRPAAGKTTLANRLRNQIPHPLISRDELKEGYIQTTGTQHPELPGFSDLHIYETFFEVLELLISQGISLLVEAAFQDPLWRPKLLNLQEKASIKVIICEISPEQAQKRFKLRLDASPNRAKFHGDDRIGEDHFLLSNQYQPFQMDYPTINVDTQNGYHPKYEDIVEFIMR